MSVVPTSMHLSRVFASEDSGQRRLAPILGLLRLIYRESVHVSPERDDGAPANLETWKVASEGERISKL